MSKIILMIMFSVLSNSAMADWAEVSSEGNITTYANPASIRKTGNKVKMWSLIDLKMATTVDGKSAMSLVGQSEFDCKEEQARNLYNTYYSENMGRGRVVSKTNEPAKWMPVPPETVFHFLWKVACGKTKVVNRSAVEDWIKVDDRSLITAYYIRDVIHKDGRKGKLWILYDHKTPNDSSNGTWKSMKVQSEYDCKKKQLRNIATSVHSENMAGGKAIFTDATPQKWVGLEAANEVEKMVWETMCNAGRTHGQAANVNNRESLSQLPQEPELVVTKNLCVEKGMVMWQEQYEKKIAKYCDDLAKEGHECRTTAGQEERDKDDALEKITVRCNEKL